MRSSPADTAIPDWVVLEIQMSFLLLWEMEMLR